MTQSRVSSEIARHSAEEGQRRKLLDVNAREFSENLWRQGFKVSHGLSGNPAFQLSRLLELAERLTPKQVVYYSGQVAVNQPDQKKRPRNGLSVAETIRQIEECRSWMVLRNVETDPEYAELMGSTLKEVYAEVGSSIRGTHREEAFIFVSSPNSVTPFHMDEEHNFLLQIRGSKEVSLWDPADRTVIPEDRAEHQLQIWKGEGYYSNLPFKDEFQSRANVFRLTPGEGVYFPVGAPHWVKSGAQVSVSFSVTFRSSESQRQATVYFMNGKLRKLGLNPVPPGQSPWRDSLKCGVFGTVRQTARFVAGSWLRRNQSKWA